MKKQTVEKKKFSLTILNILDDRYRSSGAVNTACPDARYR